MWEKGKPDTKLVEKSDAWVTLTWFVVGRKEIMQQHHNCTYTRFIIHWASSSTHKAIFPAPRPATWYTAGDRHRQSSLVERKGEERE